MTDLERLSAALERLAAPALDQIRYLDSLGVGGMTDELTLEFDDAYRPIRPRLEGLRGGTALEVACQSVDQALQRDALGWTYDDLSGESWSAVRREALHARAVLEPVRDGDQS